MIETSCVACQAKLTLSRYMGGWMETCCGRYYVAVPSGYHLTIFGEEATFQQVGDALLPPKVTLPPK